VIHCLTAGGASLATIAAAANPSVRARILSLTPSEPAGRSLAASADLQVIECSSFDHALNELDAADIVHAHVWNAPELYEVLRADLPPARLLMWVHVAGRALPQVISPAIVARADVVVATSTRCFQHIEPAGRMCRLAPRLILPTRDLTKFGEVAHVRTNAFTIGYVGAIDDSKLSSKVIGLCARMKLPNASFLFVGNGRHRKALERQADALDNRQAFRFVGFQEDVTPFLAEFDVFGYPMSPKSFASMDLSLIEAMSAGVPAVVLSPDGTCDGIRTGVDGYIVGSEEEYIARIAELASQHERRKAMARAARANTLEKFSLPRLWQSFDRIYDELLSLPKRPRAALERANGSIEGQAVTRGADALLLAFGAAWPA
jgi:glycosyltransferase involved in cell wall biosynthesis